MVLIWDKNIISKMFETLNWYFLYLNWYFLYLSWYFLYHGLQDLKTWIQLHRFAYYTSIHISIRLQIKGTVMINEWPGKVGLEMYVLVCRNIILLPFLWISPLFYFNLHTFSTQTFGVINYRYYRCHNCQLKQK